MNLRDTLGACARLSLPSIVLLCGLSTSARADANARAEAESLISAVEARPADGKLAAGVSARVRHALARALQARNAGDQRHGSELEALALELAELARDLVRAAEAEKKLSQLEQRAIDAETRVVRARALVEQAAARRGRAAAQLRAAEAEKLPTSKVPARSAAPKADAPAGSKRTP